METGNTNLIPKVCTEVV